MNLLKTLKTAKSYYVIPLILSIIFTYNYTDFSLHASIGAGYAYTAKSLVLEHTYNIDNFWQQAGADTIELNGHHYIPYAPLPAFAFALTYFILQITYYFYTNFIGQINGDFSLLVESIFLSLPSTFALIGTGFLVNKILIKEKVEKKVRSLTIMGLLLGTQLFTYSVTYYKHNISAFFVISAIYFYFYSKSKYKYLFTSFFIGLSLLTELPTVLITIPILLNQLIRLKNEKYRLGSKILIDWIYLSLPTIFLVLLLGALQWLWFGSFFTTGDSLYQNKLISQGLRPIGFDRNVILGLYGQYLSPIKGLLLISPFLVFGFVKNFLGISKNTVFWGYILIVSIVYGMWGDCFGASPFGPRHITTVIPILAILSAIFIKNKNKYYNLYKVLIIASIIYIITITYDGIAVGEYNKCKLNNPIGHKKFINRLINLKEDPAPLIIKQLIYGKNY